MSHYQNWTMSHNQNWTTRNAPGSALQVVQINFFEPIAAITRPGLERLASIHGLALECSNEIPSDRPPSWHKIRVIERLFDQGYEFVLWIDADAAPVNYDPSPVDLIRDGKDLYLVKHTIGGNEVPNMGVFLIRNSQWSRQLLRQMWDQDRYIHHKWWENGRCSRFLDITTLSIPNGSPR
jgi:hypothetical protein